MTRSRRRTLALLGLWAAASFAPLEAMAAADPQVGPTDSATVVLGLMGLAPHYAKRAGSYQLGLGFGTLAFQRTNAFRELPGAEGAVTFGGFAISPAFIGIGRPVGYQVNTSLGLGTRQTDAAFDYERSFQLQVMYHAGLNLIGLLGGDGTTSLTLGPILNVQLGPKVSAFAKDGRGEARFSRVAVVQLGPALGFSTIGRAGAFGAMVGWVPPGRVANVVTFYMGSGNGAFAARTTDAQTLGDGFAMLDAYRADGAVLGSVYLAKNLGGDPKQPGLSLGLRADYRRTPVRTKSDAVTGVPDALETELRIFAGLGIAMP
jgi:hypothetical protein